jgi:hypothetical protein
LAFGVWRLAFGVRRSAFGVRRSAFGDYVGQASRRYRIIGYRLLSQEVIRIDIDRDLHLVGQS